MIKKGEVELWKIKPFVHMLKTPLAKYAFDVNTNQLIQVNEELYDYLKNQATLR